MKDNMEYQIEFAPKLGAEDLALINQGLTEGLTTGMPTVESFSFVLRSEQKKLLGAATGNLMFGSIYTSLLWVSQPLRGQGYGRRLMEAVEELGKTKNCHFATVNTFSFQALPFYLNLGYQVEFERKGYLAGAINYFLRKELERR